MPVRVGGDPHRCAQAATMTRVRRSSPAPAEQMIAALIPAPLPRARPPRPPLPRLPAKPAGPDQVEPYLDLGWLDPSGRISARLLLHLLGWPPGHRVTFDIAHGVITVTSAAAGRHNIGATGLLAIPGAVRQLCHLTAGDVVVLLADPGRDLLLIHPARTVAQLLAEQFATADDA
ncbi:hypothetical protein OHA72_27735 [Dactylosporangium sp. NBC_01737]|uniref:AbrB/MazE/SpoVT family DNA-binding domain-containing protein n=1 Tax=Dactylosporangium sp. NBC_01737 TaxID=2975959 RepID=UPI002E14945A|nr:hypothetical protein OHA72_27735 [Dactylosporangium sp. NBC_01737]